MRVEAALHESGWVTLASLDEVGRGALCGPVTVGAVIVLPAAGPPPRGLRDSKLLLPEQRQALVPRIQRWVHAWSVAHASSEEIDAIGIIGALRLAGRRAIAGLPVPVDGVLLDGNHDYLSDPKQVPDQTVLPVVDLTDGTPPWFGPPVRTQVKGDLRCASVAAASILAKTTRDAIMLELAVEHPEYGWAENKGYAAPAHRQALRDRGPTNYHRRSWRLGLDEAVTEESEAPLAAADLVP
jgi:ribonuclease HII